MDSRQVREKFLEFFKEKGHAIIPSASLIPENDPTVLFTTAGMHPLVPFLMGEKHPAGKRLVSCQKCIRTGDIDEVGDQAHHTFFEMLGNWSLGDYWKEDAIKWSLEFLTDKKWLGLKKDNLAVSFFAGDGDAPKDEETKKIWLSLGIAEERIRGLSKKDNWWGPAGQTGPCGPDTEMFYWSGSESAPKEFDPKDNRWVEIWNDVFMQYFKNMDGVYEPLSQKNVDTGMGLERTVSVINGLGDDYRTDVFWPIIQEIEELSNLSYGDKSDQEYINKGDQCWVDTRKKFRIIADHIKAAVFIIGDKKGVEPSNIGQGYVVRRLLRRAIRYGKTLNLNGDFLTPLIKKTIEIYGNFYVEIKEKENYIIDVVKKEVEKFEKTLEEGIKALKKIYGRAIGGLDPENLPKGMIIKNNKIRVDGREVFRIYQAYGLPIEISQEIMTDWGLAFDDQTMQEAEEASETHQELSRTASAGMFKGGLADSGEKSARYHTATHLLLAALRQVLGDHVYQRGSNINAERMRFDFSHPEKLTAEQLKKIEDIVNEKIKEDIPVVCQTMPLEEAKKKNMMGIFENKYGDQVKTYVISEFSKEICGGPHANRTSELGEFKIIKEESSGSGVRRIKAILK